LPAVDVSKMNDDELALKIAHLFKIRDQESKQSTNENLQTLLNGQRT
jgi:hypothetical protein